MNTTVAVSTYAHSVTYVADNILLSLKEIIRESGLGPEKLVSDWRVLQRGISTWLQSRHLQQVVLEVYDQRTGAFVGRWDFDISYGMQGNGTMWLNTEDVRYHILKSGRWPSTCDYRIVVTTSPGRREVDGWSATTLRSTAGFVRQSIGTTIDGSGIAAGAAYWRRA
jgi:hypothetical protein